MDRAITLTHLPITPENNDDNQSTLLFHYEPMTQEESEKRGNLTGLIDLQVYKDHDLNISELVNTLQSSIQDSYYDLHHENNPLEALQIAVNDTLKTAHSITQNKAKIEMCAYAIWGRSLYFYNPNKCTIGIRKNKEFFELDDMTAGTEMLKDDDLVVLCTPMTYENSIKIVFREHQPLENAAMISQLQTDTNTPPISLLHVHQQSVPGEEEIIEIHIPHEEESKTSIKEKILSLKPSFNKPTFMTTSKKSTEPTVYIETDQQKTGKKKKAIIASILGILLVGSLAITLLLNKQEEVVIEDTQSLENIRSQVDRADQLALLNPKEALSIVNEAQTELGSVQGVRDETIQEQSSLNESIQSVINKIYMGVHANIQPAELPADVTAKLSNLNESGLYNTSGELLAQVDSEWKTPIAVSEYRGNRYILDSSAQQIWKYLDLGGSFDGPYPYIKDAVDLGNARDLTIDGSIYVLFNNEVQKFTVGKREDFGLKGTYPPLTDNSQLTTSIDGESIYISTVVGIAVFNKDGNYSKLLTTDRGQDITQMVMNDDGSSLYILVNDSWWLVSNP